MKWNLVGVSILLASALPVWCGFATAGSPSFGTVPEPASLILLGTAVTGGFSLVAWRRRNK